MAHRELLPYTLWTYLKFISNKFKHGLQIRTNLKIIKRAGI